ncbi:ash family protein [Salmonella enterica]|nr:ash family protein [Salmonella enterica]EGF3848309.1 ash family protein [Salmonella enterica]
MKPSKALDRLNCWRYSYHAPYKTGAGRGNPKLIEATRDAESVFFCVRHMRHFMAWCCLSEDCNPCGLLGCINGHHAAHNGVMCGCCVRLRPAIDAQNRISRRPIMVMLAGQPQGWPDSLISGISTPVNVTALFERGNSSGDSLTRSGRPFIMAKSAQSQLVILPYVSAVDPESSQLNQWLQETEIRLLDRVKAALDEAGVAWIDPRTKERSKPATTDSVEGSDNA